MKEEKQGLPRRTADRFGPDSPQAVRFQVVSHVSKRCFSTAHAYRQSRTLAV
jgi:hypothetical protein